MSAWAEADAFLEVFAAELTAALDALDSSELVSVHRTDVGERATYRYGLRVLHGGQTFFRTKALETDERFIAGWAHLLRPGRPSLRLAPGIFCVEDCATEQVHIYSCRTLALEPGCEVELLSLVGGAELTQTLPP